MPARSRLMSLTPGCSRNQQGAVTIAFFPGEIVQAKHTRGLALGDLGAADEPRASYRDWSASPGASPTAPRLCLASREGDLGEELGLSQGTPGVGVRERREA